MIDDKTTATTAEICLLAGFSKQHLGKLERAGIVKRAVKDQWPLAATMRALIEDANARAAAHSASRAKLDDLRAKREALKLQRECHDLVRRSEFETAIDFTAFTVLRHLDPVPARLAGRDLTLRRRCEAELRTARAGMAKDMRTQADSLKDTGRAA